MNRNSAIGPALLGWAGLPGLISSPSGIDAVMKTRSPQTQGEPSPTPGSSTFHLICSVADHFSGRPLAPETRCALGPLHCGQLLAAPRATSAAIAETEKEAHATASNKIGVIRLSPWVNCQRGHRSVRTKFLNTRPPALSESSIRIWWIRG